MVVYKYCANGNDFLIFHSFVKKNRATLAKRICNRFSGIGADGLVVLLPHSKYAYEWEFYNSDGSIAEMCGNASRCAGHYAYSLGLAKKTHSFLSRAREIKVSVNKSVVASNLGRYKDIKKLENLENIKGLDIESSWYYINTGVPHLVCFVKQKSDLPTHKTKLMESLRKRFNANVNFAYMIDSTALQVCTYERGVEDITLACGTGMAACFVVGHLFCNLQKQVKAIPPSLQPLNLWLEDKEIYLKGAVSKVGICTIEDK